jgi:hypothetical protein
MSARPGTVYSSKLGMEKPSHVALQSGRLGFKLTALPSEIRIKVYEEYFCNLSAIEVTKDDAASTQSSDRELWELTPLVQASPFFKRDVPTRTFYQTATFSFALGGAMRTFAAGEGCWGVRKVVVEYGVEKGMHARGRDWVLLLNECFEWLEVVEFKLAKMSMMGWEGWNLEGWWTAVVDAVREGQRGLRTGLKLRCNLEGIAVEVVC